MSNADIINAHPQYICHLSDIERARQTLLQSEHKEQWRNLEVTYIWGPTAVGKTRYVMDKYGYQNVYRITNYKHPFDSYNGEDVIVFDEFTGAYCVSAQSMNNYCDGYPLSLPARYADKTACYTKVYIISNLDLRNLYRDEQTTYPAVWGAFVRRINRVIHYKKPGVYVEYSTKEYLSLKDKAVPKKQETAKTYPSAISNAPPIMPHITPTLKAIDMTNPNWAGGIEL